MEVSEEAYQKRLDQFFAGAKVAFSNAEKNYRQKLEGFFEPLAFKYRVAKEIKAQTDRYLASDFNLIGIMNPDENKISDVIVQLLKPNGAHGQGRKFFDLFAEELGITEVASIFDNQEIEVIREAETDEGRRIDILIKMVNDERKFLIGIENKLWAQEQEKQLSDYNKYLEKGDYMLIYLDALAREPETLPAKERRELEKQGKFKALDYANFLRDWLEACYKECEADKIRWFIRDFIEWIDKNYKEVGYGYK